MPVIYRKIDSKELNGIGYGSIHGESEIYLDYKEWGKIPYDESFKPNVWHSPEVFYNKAHIKGYEPMTAKELETEEEQDNCFNSDEYYIEEKFDGTRALVYFVLDKCRVFSRRISKKTGFYVENTDSLPHIRETDIYDLHGTILDGEMFIEGLPFKEVSSTLNCLPENAVMRQIEKGFITFHAFDILFYKGIDLRRCPLIRRKKFLKLAVQEAENPFIKEVEYFSCGESIGTYYYDELIKRIDLNDVSADGITLELLDKAVNSYKELEKYIGTTKPLTPRAYYELIVALGGEGVIVKPKNGKYLHKRGWEYSKVKKFLTRDLIIMGFDKPTREYTGKDVKTWEYWENEITHKYQNGLYYGVKDMTPVTKFYFYNQVGNLILGVIINKDEYDKIPKNKRGNIVFADTLGINSPDSLVMTVCECGGFDDSMREYFTKHEDDEIGKVVEVKANEIFKDSGKLRHPRFLRVRDDKSPEQCIWKDHLNK